MHGGRRSRRNEGVTAPAKGKRPRPVNRQAANATASQILPRFDLHRILLALPTHSRQFAGDVAMWKALIGIALLSAASTISAKPSNTLRSPFHRGINVLGYDPYWADASKR